MIGAGIVALTRPALAAPTPTPTPGLAGIRRLVSTRDHDATVAAIEQEVRARRIHLFATVDQSSLGKAVGIAIARSSLILFGNPLHGLRFLAVEPAAGLDWPVRMLVTSADGRVAITWTDFGWMADRYRIGGLDGEIDIANRTAEAIARVGAGLSPAGD